MTRIKTLALISFLLSGLCLSGIAAAQSSLYSFTVSYSEGNEFELREVYSLQGNFSQPATAPQSGYFLQLKREDATLYSTRFLEPAGSTLLHFTTPAYQQAQRLVIYSPQGAKLLESDLTEVDLDQRAGGEVGVVRHEDQQSPNGDQGEGDFTILLVSGALITGAVATVLLLGYYWFRE